MSDMIRIHITVHTDAFNHTKGTQVGKNKIVTNVSTEFHNYRVDVTPYAIRSFIDILMNIAVVGNWGG